MSSILNRIRLTNISYLIYTTVPLALVVIRIFKLYVLVLKIRSIGLIRPPNSYNVINR